MLNRIMMLFAIGYAAILALVLTLGLMTIASMNHLHAITDNLYEHPFTVNNAAQEMRSSITQIRNTMLEAALSSQIKIVEPALDSISSLDMKTQKDLGIVEAGFLGDMGRVQNTKHLLDEWRKMRNQAIHLARKGEIVQARDIVAGNNKIFAQLETELDYIVDFTRQKAASFVRETDEEARAKIRLAGLLLAGLIAAISIIGWIVGQRMMELIKTEEHSEKALKKYSTQLEASNKELESFSYSVSHDLRVPLRAIDGFSRILLDDYGNQLDAEGQRLLTVVRDNTKKMAQLIDDILAFSRTGRMDMALVEIDMEELARSVVAELKPAAEGRKMEMQIKTLPPILADRAMMRRVLTNLLSNAIKFTRPKETAQIEVGAAVGENEIVYYVKDNGAGFDMKYVDKLFGVFLRLHGVEEFEGTGIGLAIVKRIIDRHGGRVWAEGKVDEGATVYFALPKEKKHE